MRLPQISLALTAPRRSGASGPANSATDWYFAQFGLAGTPWADVSRTGLGTRVDSAGLVGCGPHNLAPKSEGIDTSAPWGASDFAIQQNAMPSPEGPAFLDRLTATSTPNATVYGMTAPDGPFWVSFYVSLGNRPSINLLIRNGTTATSLNGCNLQPSGSGAANGWEATAVGAGIFRVSIRVSSGFSAGDILQIYYGATGAVTPGLFWFVGGMKVWVSRGPTDTDVYPYIRTTGSARYLPRITHDPVTLSALGLLVEGQATNEIGQHSLASPQMVTQTITVTAAQRTLSFYGTGTVTLTGAHSAAVVGTGAYPSRRTLTFTPSAGSLTLAVSGTAQFPQLETGSVATSYIPNPGTGSAVRVADSAGPGVALTGAALAAAFPGGLTQPFTQVIRYRKGYSVASNETLFALSAGSTAGGTNLLALRTNGTQAQLATSAGAGTLSGALVHDGSTVNRIAVSVDPVGGRMSVSVNGAAAVETTGIAYTGAGVAAFIFGSQTYAGAETVGAMVVDSRQAIGSSYITGAALQALTA